MLLCMIRPSCPSDPVYRWLCDPSREMGLELSFSHRVGWGGSLPVEAAPVLVPLLTLPPSLDRCCIRAQLVALCSATATDATQWQRDDNDDDDNNETTTRRRRACKETEERTTRRQGDNNKEATTRIQQRTTRQRRDNDNKTTMRR